MKSVGGMELIGGIEQPLDAATEIVKGAPKDIFNYALIIFSILTVGFHAAFFVFWDRWMLVTGAFCLFFAFHFAVRIGLFHLFIFLFQNIKFNMDGWYFREKRAERKIYKILGVAKWKRFFPTYYKKSKFDVTPRFVPDHEMIAYNMCLREMVHLVCYFVTIPALLVLLYAGYHPWVWITLISVHVVGTFICDIVAIIVQRYNRPRVLKLIAMKKVTAKQ